MEKALTHMLGDLRVAIEQWIDRNLGWFFKNGNK